VKVCHTTSRPSGSTAAQRPRWGLLYGTTFPPLVALVVLEVAGPSGAARVMLRVVLALATFAAMAVWVRSNRPALDLQQWCDCAAASVTMRVIPSHRAAAAVRRGGGDARAPERDEDRAVASR